jgi:hypothetical protein
MFSSLKKWVDTNILLPTTEQNDTNPNNYTTNFPSNSSFSKPLQNQNHRNEPHNLNLNSLPDQPLQNQPKVASQPLKTSPGTNYQPESSHVDLSHLSKQEQEQIAAVLERAKNEEIADLS